MFPANVTQTDVQYYNGDSVDDYDEELYDETGTEDGVDDSESDMYSNTNMEMDSTYEGLNTPVSNNTFLENYKELKLGEIKYFNNILNGRSYRNPFTVRIKNKMGNIRSVMLKYRIFSPVAIGTVLTLLLLCFPGKLAFITGSATILIISYFFVKLWKCQNIVDHEDGIPEL
ncbi:hypothetical protein C922_05351 [Plasmodium inui San Antonio 1]|uniref:Uncharacterized protein n=1 Tax=Plasmodium inui San Antonio 1 TaxID=1237626 RepID=W7A587_9APIC|nr:hypothetical protein C922_05351 [Plasmodium inui San Antonio 1]EUD64264.1 hypothetical protein C922_05351 [Plasmodium inui San Antonio 1]